MQIACTMHTEAMDLHYIKTQGPSLLKYAPIDKAFAQEKFDPATKERLVKEV